MEKILYVCTAPGLESYSIGLISAAFSSKVIDLYVCVFLNASDQRTKAQLILDYSIQSATAHKILFLQLPANKVKRILSSGSYLNQVAAFATRNGIRKIHFISQDVILWGYLHKFKNFSLYYTVHDLHPHEVKLSKLQKLKHWYFRIRKDRNLMKTISRLVTNSTHQWEALKERYPNKKVYLHAMPGLITPAIRAGTKTIKELDSVSQYILFFGKIEWYKGLDLLYQAFVSIPELKNIKLVIAGKGDIYFNREPLHEDHIIFINRYIADHEMNDLFGKAAAFVMPYRSATQSAVTSLAYHYGLPVIASGISALKETVKPDKTGFLFPMGDVKAMASQILKIYTEQELYQKIATTVKEGHSFYDPKILQQQLEEIYTDK
ncbi:glycosyltransferase family 4 protein [Pedobacter metabolipauper]|uniref:Glycosyltransferase involved in cell wall biosynthesis n=1 Tax=Pedobacter metabolipauper TaxID=425513 RepID=A0A4R6SWW5_9SPHI|nr:glycosyltransferase family 4 protein [Pedobacter metabolipauper]TDQ09909.1 glycosyltransferase involved in cell wall biosynthesis [Pedobacter metabolipauper]